MKKIYFLLPALLLSQLLAAKGTINGITTTNNPGSTGGMFPPHFGNNNQTSGPAGIFKLVAKTNTVYNETLQAFVPVDSVTYEFSNGRNGYIKEDDPDNDETVLFDVSSTYYYNAAKGEYDKRLIRSQTYNQANQVRSITYTTYKDAAGGWLDSIRYWYDYDNGKMISSSLEVKNGPFWTSSVDAQVQYDAGNIKSYSSRIYKADFDYNGDKLMSIVDEANIQGTWYYNQKKLYTYNGDNVSSYTIQKWNDVAGSWINDTRNEYVYDGKNLLSSEEFSWNGSNWSKATLHQYTYDANGNKLTDLKQVWNHATNAYENKMQEIATYNKFGQPVTITTQNWVNGAWAYTNDNTQMRYYYDFPTSVDGPVMSARLSTYPVPAANVINLDVALDRQQSFSISLVNMQGRIVLSKGVALVSSYKESMDISNLPSGNYFIKLKGEQLDITERIVVVH